MEKLILTHRNGVPNRVVLKIISVVTQQRRRLLLLSLSRNALTTTAAY